MGEAGLPLSGALFCPPEQLTPAQRIDELVALERQLAAVQARQCRVLVAMTNETHPPALPPELDRQWVREDVRVALGESAAGANTRLAVADALVNRFPATLTALSRGEVSWRQARLLWEQTSALQAAAARDVEAAALDAVRAPGADRTLSAFGRVVRRAVMAADPDGAEQRHRRAAADRRVGISPDADAMATLWGSLPAQDGRLVDAALDFLARHAIEADPDDPRTRAQRRADALVAMARGALTDCGHCTHAHEGGRGRATARPSIQVSVALSTLLGLDDQPGELAGHGPIHAALARRLAADGHATWRRLVTDELGHLVDYGRDTYRPPADLDRHVRARDAECVFPTCHRRAEGCEIDHTVSWDDGGTTCADNLRPVCSRHHHAKHDAGWALCRHPDGTLEWGSPAGLTYLTSPTTYPVDRTGDRLIRDVPAAAADDPATEADPDPPHKPPF